MKFTPRERVLRAAEHKEADRIPITNFGIHLAKPHGYRGLCKYYGITDYEEPQIFFWNQPWNMDERLLEKMGVDFRGIRPPSGKYGPFMPGYETLPNGYIRGFHGQLWKPGFTHYNPAPDHEQAFNYGKTVKDVEEYPYWSVPGPELEASAQELAKVAKKQYEDEDYAILSGLNTFYCECYQYICGYMKFFTDMKRNPEFWFAVADKIEELAFEYNRIILGAVGDYVDILMFPDDMGTQEGPYFPLETFRKFVLPYWKRGIKNAKKYAPKAKVELHCCGSILPYIPDMASAGIDILQAIQPNAANMQPENLKKFSDIICFAGGLDLQYMLPYGTRDEIRGHVKRYMDTLAPGYMFGPSNTMTADFPPKNIATAFEAAIEFGTYPLKTET